MRRPTPTAALILALALEAVLAGCSAVGEDGGSDIGLLSVPDPEADR